MKSIKEYFGCGKLSKDYRGHVIYLSIIKQSDIYDNLIPFFIKYPLQGFKRLDLESFREIAELMKRKEHLTIEGLEKIREIKSILSDKQTRNIGFE